MTMANFKFIKLITSVLMVLLIGCGVRSREFTVSAVETELPITNSNTSTPRGTDTAQEIPFEVCGNYQDWVRPTLNEQINKLKSEPRYRDLDPQAIENDLIWQNQIFTVNTYGLSYFVDYFYLSGLWSVPQDIFFEACSVSKINSGEVAYLILLQYRVEKIYWQNGQYVMLVESTPKGFQVVQFRRQDGQPQIPLKIVEYRGKELKELVASESDFITGWH